MTEGRSPTRVAVFVAGGPIALKAVLSLAEANDVVAIVRLDPRCAPRANPGSRALRLARRLRPSPPDQIVTLADAAGIPILTITGGDDRDAADRLRDLDPDYGCIATFPIRLGPALLAASGSACINLHSSLLPRHRGADPLFWTYHAGDLEGGVTVHIATAELDAGPVLARTKSEIGLAEPVTTVHARYASLGGPLLARTIESLEDGSGHADPQDDDLATAAPRVEKGRVYSQLTDWSAERAWHFLGGLVERYREPFTDDRGRVVRYGRVPGFEIRSPRHAPGSIVREGSGWSAWARDGVVHLAR